MVLLGTWRALWLATTCLASAASAMPGLDSRAPISAYLNGVMPTTGMDSFSGVQQLSQTGVFSNTPAMTPHPGLVPYGVNSPLWSDGASKKRWIALPYDGTASSPVIQFSPSGKWVFPNGTAFVKHFELVVNEQTGERRRLETRILVRDANGGVYGRSYRWRPDNLDADIVPNRQNAPITITGPDGVTTRIQNWTFPGPNDCTRCHNNANSADPNGTGFVLGIKTRQLNGQFQYESTGRTDNQIRTWNHLGMFSPGVPSQASYPEYDQLVQVTDSAAPLQHRVRSYLDANCGFCHQGPGANPNPGEGPLYDARFTTPVLSQQLVDEVNGQWALRRRDLENSRIYIRDSSTTSPMPPLARNVPDPHALATIAEWVNYAFDVVEASVPGSANQVSVRFDRQVTAATAGVPSNYAIAGIASVIGAALQPDGRTVVLTTSSDLTLGASYQLTVNRVEEAAAPNNPIWPNTTFTFVAEPGASANVDPHDLNDDGRGDLLWQNTGDGSVQGWLMNGVSATQVVGLLPADGYTITHVADLNGDGKADTLIRHLDGSVIGWLHNGLSVTSQAGYFGPGSGWSVKQTPDMNGDGKADLIVEHTDGRVVGWLMDGLTVTGTATFVPAGTGWHVAKVGDLNGDGKTDLIWQNTNGTVQAWLMDGFTATQVVTFVGAGSGWNVKLVGDMNGDGRADLVWQNMDGTVQAWLMNGLTVSQIASFVPAGTGWSPVLLGDISGDGKTDVFWQHTDGRSQTWLMDGLTVTSLAGFVGAGNWSATHLIDLNGDGRKDVLWRNTDGTVQAWLLNGLTITQIASLAGPGTYLVIPPREP